MRISLIYLLIFSLVLNLSMVQLARLPKMLAHFEIHKKSNDSIGIIKFLALHYLNKHGSTKNDQSHHDLPFKGITSVPDLIATETFSESLLIIKLPFNSKIRRSDITFDTSIGFIETILKPPAY